MKKVEVRRRVALGGRVVDSATGAPVEGAVVDAGPAGNAVADASGRFAFLDLPSGTYAVSASDPGGGRRRGTAGGKAKVTRSRAGDVRLAWVELQLPATTISGKVTGSGGRPVALASVHVVGGTERAYTDAQGRYTLAGVEAGARRLRVRARGHEVAEVDASVDAPGGSKTVDVALTAASP